ncbi:MAG: hypothetical protein HEQ22_03375 [Sphingopyxis sp.]|uniref:hypothetical protein n=1 Tax=Sphingopyxis sp. TaxID=1908224 RepID=UPI003D80C9BB
MFAKERLYLTGDGERLVREGDRAAATLYAAAGDEIPDSAVQRFGLANGTLGTNGGGTKGSGTKDGGGKQPGGDKEKQPGGDKEKTPDGDKAAGAATGAGAGGDVTPPGPDDLTLIKFVGTRSAEALTAAGITSFAQVAAIDPAKPPVVEGMGARVNWGAIVASAIELHEAAAGNGGAGDAGQGV